MLELGTPPDQRQEVDFALASLPSHDCWIELTRAYRDAALGHYAKIASPGAQETRALSSMRQRIASIADLISPAAP